MLDLVWLAIAFPLAGALVNGLFGRAIRNKLISGIIGCTALGLSFLVAILTFISYNGVSRTSPFYEVYLWPWIHVGALKIDALLLIDPLSIVMMLFITGVSFLIHIYSTGYMAHDDGYPRFFTYLNLFVAMMLILVLGGNGLVMFVGWEGVGLCSYLLIGFWYHDMYNAKCGMKAFVVNRIGDFGVLIGIFLLYSYFGTLRFTEIFSKAPLVFASAESWVPLVIALFLFLGATGKSAQLPLHIWLPDAMAGPTPVSALIHAATMVTAGVYMVARLNPVFAANHVAGLVVAIVGCLTAFVAASIALTQNDIKKVLAYSTVSQLGYMFLACGVGAYWVAIFHVVTHAFFKACLFLCSGSVIHGMHEEQDTRVMGGLGKYMPWTYGTFVVSTFAIAGVVPFAGFFSKDEILWQTAIWQSMVHWLPGALWGLALFTALLTAFYMGRVTWKTFLGKPRWSEQFVEHHAHPHESGGAMVMPLVVLALLATIGGAALYVPAWMGGGHHVLRDYLAPSTGVAQEAELAAAPQSTWIAQLEEGSEGGHSAVSEAAEHGAAEHERPFWVIGSVTTTEIIFALGSVLLALLMLYGVAFPLYTARYGATEAVKQGVWRPFYLWSFNKWYFDEFYHRLLVIPGVWLSHVFWRVVDLRIIDGIVNGVAWVLGALGQLFRPLQTGFIRNYALYLVIGAVLFLLYNLVAAVVANL